MDNTPCSVDVYLTLTSDGDGMQLMKQKSENPSLNKAKAGLFWYHMETSADRLCESLQEPARIVWEELVNLRAANCPVWTIFYRLRGQKIDNSVHCHAIQNNSPVIHSWLIHFTNHRTRFQDLLCSHYRAPASERGDPLFLKMQHSGDTVISYTRCIQCWTTDVHSTSVGPIHESSVTQ